MMKSPISHLATGAMLIALAGMAVSCTSGTAPTPEGPAAAASSPVALPATPAAAPSTPETAPSASTIGAVPSAERATTFKATESLNLRKGAGTGHRILSVLPKGAAITKTGKVSGAWWQVRSGAHEGWISPDGDKAAAPEARKAPKAHADRWVIEIQPTYAGASFASQRQQVVSGMSRVGLIRTSGKWSEVEVGKARGWILSDQLEASEAKARGRQAVPVRNAERMVPNASKTVKQLEDRYGSSISTVYGPRSGSVGHSSGLAADVMIKKYSAASGIKAGNEMAEYVVKNHQALGIDYVIWRDRIWLVEDLKWGPYSKGGWGKHLEATRGWNPTTLHMDHLHIEVFPK